MPKFLSEDAVRDADKISLELDKNEAGAQQGTGQLTTFNMLGIKGVSDKPDGWYIPDNKNSVSILLETKNSDEDVNDKKWIEEIKKNCDILLNAGYTKVIGILHNGYKTQGFFNNNPINIPNEIQNKQYYINLVNNQAIDKDKIDSITKSINNNLHINFGIKNLYHRMIFTACSLVAERYGAQLQRVKDLGYNLFRNRVFEVLSKSLEKDKEKNAKLQILLDQYLKIEMNTSEKQEAINKFIDDVREISDCINSNEWQGEDVMGIFFNEFNRYKKKSEAGQIFTPEHITSFMYRLINVTEKDFVGDFCCGSGAFLIKSMSNMMKAVGGYDTKEAKDIRTNHLFGIEWDKEIYALACANMLIHKDGKTNLEHNDMRTEEACSWVRSKPITKVLMNPPYERQYGCMKIVENVLDSVKNGTECAFILPDKKLEKTSKGDIKRILSNHKLTKIIKLPKPLFFNVGVETSIFVFISGQPQNNQEIFCCYIEDDGLETVKNKGRHDIKNRWPKIEDYWIDSIRKLRDEKYKTAQWIKPNEHLSYQMPEKPFEISEKDLKKAAMDYLCFQKEIDTKNFFEKILNLTLYASKISSTSDTITIEIKKDGLINDCVSNKWGEFRISDIFEVVKGSRLTKSDMKEGTIKFIGSSAMNNGETARIGNKEHLHPANTITVCYNGSVGETFYQDEEFWASDDVNVLYPKFKLDKYIALFICPIIKTIGKKYAFINKWKQETMKEEVIKLPIQQNGQPDWKYMQAYMKGVIDKTKETISVLHK